MNALALIQKRLKAQQKAQDYNRSIAYRGVNYSVCSQTPSETHGTFCYRGRIYTK